MNNAVKGVLIYFLSVIAIPGVCLALDCWLCIAEECDKQPDSYFMATRRTCDAGESCQKVYYRSYDYIANKVLESTTRSCSYGPCRSRDDFQNCTSDMLSDPGCVRHECCSDKDMCNPADRTVFMTSLSFLTGATLFVNVNTM